MAGESEAPLAGIRVIDFSAVVVGPYATKILADYGADVVKVEAKEGDLIRWIAGPSPTPGMSGKYVHLNPGKRSIALDLKHPLGKKAALALVRDADVMTINMRPEAIKRLGLAYEDVAAINPKLVYCGMVGFGENGPYRGKPAFDSIIQGASGLASLFERATGTPHYVPMVIADRSVGLMTVNAIMMALFQRTRTGRGQSIEVPMFENMAAVVLAEHLYGSTYDPPLAPPGDPRLLDPEARPVKTKDGYVCVTTNTDAQAFALMDAIGRPEMRTDPRFSTKLARAANSNVFFRVRAEEMAKKTSAEWIAILEAADIPVMPYHTLDSLPGDPHLREVGLLKRVDHPTEGRMWEIGNPIRHSAYRPPERRPPPHIGEHTGEVLREAGFDDAEIAAMFASGAASGARGA